MIEILRDNCTPLFDVDISGSVRPGKESRGILEMVFVVEKHLAAQCAWWMGILAFVDTSKDPLKTF